MAKYEILYIKDKKKKSYPKIIAIKPEGWNWSEGERNGNLFGIVKLDLTEEQVADIQNYNEYCLDDFDNPTKLADTPDDHRPIIIEEEKEVVSIEEGQIKKEKYKIISVIRRGIIPDEYPSSDIKLIRRKVKGENIKVGMEKI